MKKNILFVLGIYSFFLVSAQTVDNKFILLEGDTYSIKMFKDWLPPTAVKEYGEPLRKKRTYETTTFTRVKPNSEDRCGSSIAITEIKGCNNYLDVFRKDSLRWTLTKEITKATYDFVKGSCIKRIGVLVYKTERHPETGELSALQQVVWYLQGERNSYCVSFFSCTKLLELLPQIKIIAASLEEK